MSLLLFFIIGAVASAGFAPFCARFIRHEKVPVKADLNLYSILFGLGGALFLSCGMVYGFTSSGIIYCIFFLVLPMISVVDYYCHTVPDSCQIFLLLLAVLSFFLLPEQAVGSKLLGFVIVSVPLLILSHFTNGFGGGDVKLFAVCGLLLGVKNIVLAFLIAVILAAICGLIFIRFRKKGLQTRIAFVPFTSVGLVAATLFGDKIISWYLGLFINI